ncbi:MAG: S-methyl-5-thioribose-1-phosphate isomerase [Lachnospiraceae bacterium]|nr:S-methyl-5-thioribose-1-phosphate isomerase [Lachnospiraceae bacterium]
MNHQMPENIRPENIRLSNDRKKVIIIDQSALPNKLEYLTLDQPEECFDAIKTLKVRGAPAIGIFAAFAMYVTAQQWADHSIEEFQKKYQLASEYLNSARPTAVNLSWAIRRLQQIVDDHAGGSVSEVIALLGKEAEKIQQEDMEMCYQIASHGLSLLKEGDGILTHCNAGPLATSCYGTALGPMLLGKEQGMNFRVFADETRPLLQGARLTTYELQKAGIDVTLICDNMASVVMKNGWVDKVFVGCDRIAANGDFANKIGTSGVAILANYYHIPVYTLGPSSTIDLDTPTGADIPIELRDPDEIRTMWYKEPMAPEKVPCYNPSFDVTDHTLLAGIITEKGIVYPPFEENLKRLFR